MKILALSPTSRLRRLFLLTILAVFVLALLPTVVAQADDCLYEVHGECLEYTTIPYVWVLQRHFVIEHVDNCQRIYDVWIMAARPDIFDPVAHPVRFDSPNLQQYNNQSLIRAQGEIKERDLQVAINQGLVREISRILIDKRCNTPVISDPDTLAYKLLQESPWRVEIAATDVLTTYVHLQKLAPNYAPKDPPEAEQALIPEGMVATFLVADEANMQALIEYLNLERKAYVGK